jgi:hypothetical protein
MAVSDIFSSVLIRFRFSIIEMNFRQRKRIKPPFVYPFLRSSPTPRLQLLNSPKPAPLNVRHLTAPAVANFGDGGGVSSSQTGSGVA